MKQPYRLSQEERDAIRDRIAAGLSYYPDVLFAYVYGSFLKSEAFHNVDVGVYLSSSHFNNAMAANLSAHLSGKVKLPVDVRTLNTAPISLRLYVLRGECLFSRDDNLRTDIMEDTMRRYFDIATLLRSLNGSCMRRHTRPHLLWQGFDLLVNGFVRSSADGRWLQR